MKQFLNETSAVRILDEVEAIKLGGETFFHNVKAVYEQREGFYVRGGFSGIQMSMLEKLIAVAKKYEALLTLHAQDGSVIFTFYAAKNPVGQIQAQTE